MKRKAEGLLLLAAFLALAAQPAFGQPSVVGQWSDPHCLPNVGTHMIHLHTGKVLLWPGHYDHDDRIEAWVWDLDSQCITDQPSSGFDPACIRRVDNNETNLFCSGHSPLDDGKILITGGHSPPFGNHVGLIDANLFDPEGETWTGQDAGVSAMNFTRWYPTNTTLPDGRILTVSGSNRRCNGGDENGHNCISHDDCAVQGQCVNSVCDSGDQSGMACARDNDCVNNSGNGTCDDVYVNDLSEIYDPATQTWSTVNASLAMPFYPLNFLLPDGRVFYAGAELQVANSVQPTSNYVLDLSVPAWTHVDDGNVQGGSGVMYEPGKILKSGGRSGATANDGAEIIDMNQANPTWETVANMSAARVVHNLTLLPDGTVLATGGTRTFNMEYNRTCVGGDDAGDECSVANSPPGDSSFPCVAGVAEEHCDGGTCTGGDGSQQWVSQAELYDPSTKQWTTLSHMVTPRQYHSNAMLLPDGRVVVAGGGQGSGAIHNYSNYEIFSPPYLFNGSKPSVVSAPEWFGPSDQFFIETPDAGDIAKAALIGLAAATHGFDENQRYVPLAFTAAQDGLQVSGAIVDGQDTPFNHNVVPPGYYMLFTVNNNGVPSVGRYIRMLGDTPIALCQDVDTFTDPGLCTAEVSVDDGSFDPTGEALTLTQTPPSPYDVGTTDVVLDVSDPNGLSDTCEATVMVTDNELPQIMCNAPATISPDDAPLQFTATATDNCGVASIEVTGFDCFRVKKKGTIVSKLESCIVSVADDFITIDDVGGVGDSIVWDVMVSDVNGNQASTQCEVLVVNPNKP